MNKYLLLSCYQISPLYLIQISISHAIPWTRLTFDPSKVKNYLYNDKYPMKLICDFGDLILDTASFPSGIGNIQRSHKQVRVYDERVLVFLNICRYHGSPKLDSLVRTRVVRACLSCGHPKNPSMKHASLGPFLNY